MRCTLLNLVNEEVLEMKLKLKLRLIGIFEENVYTILNCCSLTIYFDRNSNFKTCLRPGLGAQKVVKH